MFPYHRGQAALFSCDDLILSLHGGSWTRLVCPRERQGVAVMCEWTKEGAISARAGHCGSAATFLIVPNDDSPDSVTKRQLWQRLSPVERALMATDGTLTLLLSALYGERIDVELLWQSSQTLRESDMRLRLESGGQLLVRRTLLKAAESGQSVAYAASTIVLSRLSRSIRHELENGTKPIGLLLRSEAVETHRMLEDWGDCTPTDQSTDYLDSTWQFFRTYQIISQALPLMTVTEHFPQADSSSKA